MGYNWAKQDMTHKIKIVSLLIVSAMLFFVGCKKNNSENETNETPEEIVDVFMLDELIPEEILQLLDNCPSVNYQDPSVFGFNGKSDNPLDNLFAAMCEKAMFLTNDSLSYDDEQYGLAYVNGYGIPNSYTKDYSIARIGTWVDGIDCTCQEPLYGTDCSGFIAHVMNTVGINGLFEMRARDQVDYFKNLTRLRTPPYTGLVKVEEFENVNVENIKNGDIIYKINSGNRASHIGIFFKTTTGELIMFQSAGDPSYSCQQNRHENGRGPIQKEINQDNLNRYFNANSGRARLLRITADTNWVDLGLPSDVLWATRNVGANSPKESGYYLAWGETEEDSYYDWNTYKYWTGTTDLYGNIINGSITKYNENDNLTTLQSEDDAAAIHWSNLGNNCRMPTYDDWNELITHCTQSFTTRNGVKGALFTAQNGNSLFLPAVGFRHVGGIFNNGQYDGYGFYWTSSRSTNDSNSAGYVRFNYNSENPILKEYLRLFGLSVRPVLVIPSNKN